MTTGRFLVALLTLWLLGALLYPMHGLVHFLLIVALIVFMVDRLGRGADSG